MRTATVLGIVILQQINVLLVRAMGKLHTWNTQLAEAGLRRLEGK
ncbi:hypothetical protein [Geomonas diazotrophica]|nr:hypothetical protein [Geomonas nitrogeniifigens]